jgi:hypothetical protein
MSTALTYINRLATKNLIIKLYKHYIIDSIILVKREGFKALIRERGWKVFAIIIGYYAVRDTVVYLLIPLLIAKGIF